jgi:hypothetical protein
MSAFNQFVTIHERFVKDGEDKRKKEVIIPKTTQTLFHRVHIDEKKIQINFIHIKAENRELGKSSLIPFNGSDFGFASLLIMVFLLVMEIIIIKER